MIIDFVVAWCIIALSLFSEPSILMLNFMIIRGR